MFDKTPFSILRWFWERVGAPTGAFGDLRGMSWGLSGASRSTDKGFQNHFGTLLGLVCSLLAAKDGVGSEADGLRQPPRGLGRRMALGFRPVESKMKRQRRRSRRETSGTSDWVIGTVAVQARSALGYHSVIGGRVIRFARGTVDSPHGPYRRPEGSVAGS